MIFNVGMDVSKETIQACIVKLDYQQQCHRVASRKFDNRPGAFAELVKWIHSYTNPQKQHVRLLMEASGVYHERLATYLHQNGWYVSVVLPTKARRYAQSLGMISKNDAIDAEGLARMGAHQKLPQWGGINMFWRKLRTLTRHKQQLEELKTQVNNRDHASGWSAAADSLVDRQRNEMLQQLEAQHKEVCEAIENHLRSRPEIWEKVGYLDGIKGLSVQSIAVLLAETDGFEPFTNKGQLVSYSDYDVVENQSGQSAGKTRIAKQGNSRIRRVLHFPALNVVTHEVPKFKSLWDRVYERTQIPMKAYVAVQRKLLVMCYHLWTKEVPFDPYHDQKHHSSYKGLDHKKVAPA